ncbi:hypothetical protein TNCV_2576321 [Trichonephila clavipes]|uniref:Uncharacterized protein n=1 Tax=Trichonephila clavipes TaxID=2585209 RepID=A0A8X6R6B5_TRICX|nr:hypothetical protein TNCV_2576321 [Trichonephila clavipes]
MEVAVFSFGETSCTMSYRPSIFDAGSVNGTRYCNEFFFHSSFRESDDNIEAAEQLLESEDIERMDWPA